MIDTRPLSSYVPSSLNIPLKNGITRVAKDAAYGAVVGLAFESLKGNAIGPYTLLPYIIFPTIKNILTPITKIVFGNLNETLRNDESSSEQVLALLFQVARRVTIVGGTITTMSHKLGYPYSFEEVLLYAYLLPNVGGTCLVEASKNLVNNIKKNINHIRQSGLEVL